MKYRKAVICLGVLVCILLWAVISLYPDWLWFRTLNFAPVFWTMLIGRFGVAAAIWLPMIVILFVNLYAAQRFHRVGESKKATGGEMPASGRATNAFILAAVLIVSLVIASRGSAQWDMVLSYLNQRPFGSVDPVFNKDIGFYVFSLPFYSFVREELLILFVFAGLATGIWYLKDTGIKLIGEVLLGEDRPTSMPKINIPKRVGKHLLVLGGIIVLLIGWGYYLKAYGLLYSTQGPAFGASYTDIHVKIPAFRILMVISFVWGLFLIYNALDFKKKQLLISGAVWLGAVVLFAAIIPAMVQQFVVKPNELARESRYIGYNIENTRKAYDLDQIQEVAFPVRDTLTIEDVRRNNVTIQNIRIWDERPLLQTYRQIQSIRLYYDFNNVDVDRYVIDKQLRQVTLAARELIVNQLPSQANTWVNRHLIYTHGYGLALSPVNEVTREGLPRLLIKDLPPVFDADLKIERPEIYYGEKTQEYVLVKTKTEEFDYPKGEKNVYATYQGSGGVPVTSFIRRLLFAFEFMDPQIIFTTYLSPESSIMYNRRIGSRVRVIAPFLEYDRDPYLVISEGKLYWIQDAYTISNMYPYSSRSRSPLNNKRLNYIRNSVKAVIDAYNGDVSFYLIDEVDPIAKTYARIFPELFKPLSDMPAGLRKHIRYPLDLFKIQVGTYRTYHMEDEQVFYNQEDLWQIPDEIYGDSRQEMEPYYIIMKLPTEEKEEFLLMLPFTPSKKDNMIGWLAARSDLPDYGNLVVYKLPKEKLVYGPMQIEARVDQQTEISQELSLWGQRGSRVIRGNLLAIPVGESFIYVEPVYLEAKQEAEEAPTAAPAQPRPFGKSQRGRTPGLPGVDKSKAASLPELKRVIVAFSNRLAMEEGLEKALNRVLRGETAYGEEVSYHVTETGEIPDVGILALKHYYKAKEYLREGDLAGYGREFEQLENILRQLSRKTMKREPDSGGYHN
ncbi:MAG: UPF0182 family protein [Deltaproteobacteria bacterium]|nr:UPF0182 family protein [Deltaproteobacteria bacterium]